MPRTTPKNASRQALGCAAMLALAALAALALGAQASAGEGLALTAPNASGAGAHYERLERLGLDRRSGYNSHYPLDRRAGYGQPSRILGAPLDLGPSYDDRPPGRTRVRDAVPAPGTDSVPGPTAPPPSAAPVGPVPADPRRDATAR